MESRFGRYQRYTGLGLAFLAAAAFAQQGGAGNSELQEKIAALKKSMAQSQQTLRQYAWTETTQVSLKGETKSTTHASCQYAADGKVVKTPVDTGQPPPQKQPKGVKGKVVANKKEEMSDYMKSAVALIQRYVPPDAARMQEAKAEMQQSAGGIVTLVFHDYAKPGDTLSLSINGLTNTMQSVSVKSYLDDVKDAVDLTVRFANLPDGGNYVAETVLDATAKQMQVRTTNSGYRKL